MQASPPAARPPRPLLEVRDLSVRFDSHRGTVHAVESLSYSLASGHTLSIVGESGSGKSVSVLALMGLLPHSGRVAGGSAVFDGTSLLDADESVMKAIRGRTMAMVFQDPLSALNPVFSVGRQVAEAVRIHQKGRRSAAWARALELFDLVGIPNPGVRARQYPHEFSGGMRQRAMIAMAIANNPALLIADEPTTALDVTIQAQILELLGSLQQQFGMAMILITHDLGVVAQQGGDVLVMYAGRAVEHARGEAVFRSPQHPYTIGLMESASVREDASGRRVPIPGQPPSLVDLPPGCAFHPRCPHMRDICAAEVPVLEARGSHPAACHFAGDLPPAGIPLAAGGAGSRE